MFYSFMKKILPFYIFNINLQVSPDLPDAQIPNMPTQLYPANKRLT